MDKSKSAVDVLKSTMPGAGADRVDPGEALAELARKLAEAEAREAALKARVEAAESRSGTEIRAKVSDKGAVSVYGLNARWPITLYAPQWTRLLAGCSCHGSVVERAIKAALSVPGAAERVAEAQAAHDAAKARGKS